MEICKSCPVGEQSSCCIHKAGYFYEGCSHGTRHYELKADSLRCEDTTCGCAYFECRNISECKRAYEQGLNDNDWQENAAAVRTLKQMGYTWHGGSVWRPSPENRISYADKIINALRDDGDLSISFKDVEALGLSDEHEILKIDATGIVPAFAEWFALAMEKFRSLEVSGNV